MARLLEMEAPSGSVSQSQDLMVKQGASWKVNGGDPAQQLQQQQQVMGRLERMLPSPPLTESTPEEDRMGGVVLHHQGSQTMGMKGEAIPFGTHMNMDLPFLEPATHSLRSHPSSVQAPMGPSRPRSSEVMGRVSLVSPTPSLFIAAEEPKASQFSTSSSSSRFYSSNSSSFFDGSTPKLSSTSFPSTSFGQMRADSGHHGTGDGDERESRSISPPATPSNEMDYQDQVYHGF